MIRTFLRERARKRALVRLSLPDDRAEPGLERFVDQARAAFSAPIALLTLVDEDQMWVAASAGLAIKCLARDQSFCTHAVDRGGVLEVVDALADPRFRNLAPVIGPPHTRYYIGAPLTLHDGTDVGVLCILDTRPRPPASQDQRAYLAGLARQAAGMLDRRTPAKDALVA